MKQIIILVLGLAIIASGKTVCANHVWEPKGIPEIKSFQTEPPPTNGMRPAYKKNTFLL